MTKIYRGDASLLVGKPGLWVTRRELSPLFFSVTSELVTGSAYTETELTHAVNIGTLREITHTDALDLLAHWPEGHAELTAILADAESDAETETTTER